MGNLILKLFDWREEGREGEFLFSYKKGQVLWFKIEVSESFLLTAVIDTSLSLLQFLKSENRDRLQNHFHWTSLSTSALEI